MAIVTLAEAKLHLRAATSVTSPDPDNDLIQAYIDAAEEHVRVYLDRQKIPSNAAIKAAVLLLVGDLYQNREGATFEELKENPAVTRLLFPYRRNLGI